ncbi:MAG: hypothetical protein WBF06_10085 [Candidatus Acidiferrales bacterium]
MTRLATISILGCAIALGSLSGSRAQQPAATNQTAPPAAADLRPKFTPGQVLRYQMELVTTTAGSAGGVVQDPQGPTRLVVTWDATVRIDVLPPDSVSSISSAPQSAPLAATPHEQNSTSPAALRLRMTYEKSAATIQTDGYDPDARSIQDRYQHLQGHTVELALDANGKVTDISAGDDVFETPQAARDAEAWVAQLSSGVGAPGPTVEPGQAWSADRAADGIPLPGMTWHTDSSYLRNEPCRQSPLDAGSAVAAPSAAGSAPVAGAPSINAPANAETCAVILTRVLLVPSKATLKAEIGADGNDSAPGNSAASSGANIPSGLHTSGTWTGSSESLIDVSLRTGWVVNVTQNGDERMDLTVISEHEDSLRYAGTVHSHVNLLLLPQ